MQDKKTTLIKEIKKLWENKSISEFDIAPELLEYLELSDLKQLKAKILNSLTTLSDEQKEWLKQFKKD